MAALQMDPQSLHQPAAPQPPPQSTAVAPPPQPPPSSSSSFMNGFLNTEPADPSMATFAQGGAFFPPPAPAPPQPQMSNLQCLLPHPQGADQQHQPPPPGLYPGSPGGVSGASFFPPPPPPPAFDSRGAPIPRENRSNGQPVDDASAAAAATNAAIASQQMALIAQSIQLFAAAMNGGVPRLPAPPPPQHNSAGSTPNGFDAQMQPQQPDPNANGFTPQGQFNLLEKLKVSKNSFCCAYFCLDVGIGAPAPLSFVRKMTVRSLNY